MDGLRVAVAFGLFCISSYLVYDLMVRGFDAVVLVFAIAGFWLAHFIFSRRFWDESRWHDLFEFVDWPYQSIAFFLRAFGKLLRSGDGDLD